MNSCPAITQQAKGLARSRARAWAIPFGSVELTVAMGTGNVTVAPGPASLPPT